MVMTGFCVTLCRERKRTWKEKMRFAGMGGLKPLKFYGGRSRVAQRCCAKIKSRIERPFLGQ